MNNFHLPFTFKLSLGIIFSTASPLIAGAPDLAATNGESISPLSVIRPLTVREDSTALPITTDLIQRWIELHRALLEMPDSVRAKVASQVVRFRDMAPELGNDSTTFRNWGPVAAQYPEVASAFNDATISPRAYSATAAQIVAARAVIKAREAAKGRGEPVSAPKDTTTVLERAIAVITPMLTAATAQGAPDKDRIRESDDVGSAAVPLKVDTWINPDATYGRDASELPLKDGNIYLIGFTSTWCSGCPYLYPPYEALAKEFAGQKNVRIIFVSPLFPSVPELKKYFTNKHVTVPVAVQGKSMMGDNPERYQVASLPVSILVDASGVIRHRWLGGNSDTAAYRRVLSKAIRGLLGKETAQNGLAQRIVSMAYPIPYQRSLPLEFVNTGRNSALTAMSIDR